MMSCFAFIASGRDESWVSLPLVLPLAKKREKNKMFQKLLSNVPLKALG